MINKNLSQKGSAPIVIVVILILALLGALGFIVGQRFFASSNPPSSDAPTQSEDTPTSRDATRKKHAGQFASTLFSIYLLQNHTPTLNQEGLNTITSLDDKLTADPLTHNPYVYNSEQSTLKVGEATFKVNATCDNKVSGSGKTGLIIDGSHKSIAVALKLESGEYACESNL